MDEEEQVKCPKKTIYYTVRVILKADVYDSLEPTNGGTSQCRRGDGGGRFGPRNPEAPLFYDRITYSVLYTVYNKFYTRQ